MHELPIGWATAIAVLEYSGSTVEHRGDHLLVRTPHNPTFHWGNCLLVTDPDAVDEAQQWVEAFQGAFPSATWVAIGLTRMADDREAWVGQGLELELDDVLTTATLPRQTALPAGYTVRRLAGDDWEQDVGLGMAENDRTAEYEPRTQERFLRARTQAQCTLSERDIAAFFGAFSDGALVASLGVVQCERLLGIRTSGPTLGTGPRAGRPPARCRGSVGCRPRLRPVGHRHRGHQSRRTRLPQRGV